MSKYRQDSLEDQLREEQRLAKAMRRRRRRSWLIPLLVILLVLGAVFLAVYLTSERPADLPTEAETEPESVSATILAAGDITLTPQMLTSIHKDQSYDFSSFFSSITRTVAAADLAVVNVEGNFCGKPYNVRRSNYPDSLLTALKDCGFDIIQTANSYSIENGLTGLQSTKQAIEAQGMDALGTFESTEEREQTGGVLIREVNGIRIAWIGLTKGTNGLRLPEGAESCVNLLFSDYDTNYTKIDRSGILALIDAAKSEHPDLIICMVHWGSENSSEISDAQKEIAALLLENGVDAIIGSHSHRVGPIEWDDMPSLELPHQQGLLAYSLGDLLSVSDRESSHYGCMLSFTVTKKGGVASITDVRYIPTYSAYPDEELGTSHYAVLDVLDAISLYESSHYDRVSETLYGQMQEALAQMREDTACDRMIRK